MNVAEVNIPVAVLIWLMIVPMLLKVDFGALHQVAEQWRGMAVTVGINWLVKPFSMAVLGWLFIGWLFRPWLPAGTDRQLHRRPDHPGRRALHGDGVRLVQPDPASLVAAMGAAGLLGGMIMPSRDMLVRAAAPPGAIGRTLASSPAGSALAA